MNYFQNRLQKLDSEREDRMFSSKMAAFFIFLPALIALSHAFLMISLGLPEASHPTLIMGSLLSLVAGSIGSIRAKIIRQDAVIKQLQECQEVLKQKAQATKSFEASEPICRGESVDTKTVDKK